MGKGTGNVTIQEQKRMMHHHPKIKRVREEEKKVNPFISKGKKQ
jgi:hypothetical protein